MSVPSAAELFAEAAKPARPKIDEWMEQLSPVDRAAFMEHAPSSLVSHRAFHDVIKVLGGRFSKETVTSWRRANGFGG